MKDANWKWFGIVAVAATALGMAACSNGEEESSVEAAELARSDTAAEHATAAGTAVASSEGEHAMSEAESEHAEGGEAEGEHGEAGHDEAGEEPGVYIGKAETWDVVRRGARLVLKFNPASNAFEGTVENTTESTLCAVRVEVHLSDGTELGPTPRTDVPSGQKTEVTLATQVKAFDTWTAQPEISACSG